MKTTSIVAAELGIDRRTLIKTLQRHHELRPKNKLAMGTKGITAYLWTEEEIEAMRQYYATITTGRPRKSETE